MVSGYRSYPLPPEQELFVPIQGSRQLHRMFPVPCPPPRHRTGPQVLPVIGHGPPWQSRVTGKYPSSAALQAVRTMLGCPGLWPLRDRRGWEIAPRDPFIPWLRPGLVQAARVLGPQMPGEDIRVRQAPEPEVRLTC